MTETSFAIGLVLGPLTTGALADAFGFYYATTALGKFPGHSLHYFLNSN